MEIDVSVNESIRESIQCSYVSSECAKDDKDAFLQQTQDHLRDYFVMNRMNWITYLKVLFDQLDSFTQNKQKHVDTANFIKALQKIKNLLPLLPKNDYYKTTSDIAFSYQEVEQGIGSMAKFITWDNVIDVFLSKSN